MLPQGIAVPSALDGQTMGGSPTVAEGGLAGGRVFLHLQMEWVFPTE